MPQLLGFPLHLVIVAGLLGVAVLAFVGFFVGPAIGQSVKLSRVLKRLRAAGAKAGNAAPTLFQSDRTLKHLWAEYADTLHPQRELAADSVQYEVVALRSTVPAEAFFTPQTLVDTPLKTEFFKHLPGILTGIGIFGTFFGILMGLQSFKVDSNPDVVRQSLNALLYGVHEAFLVSASAIGLAMVVTVLEKLWVASLYKKVEQLCQHLDGMYQAGAGEEYLSRLVRASESSASEAKQLKQALVSELKMILEELTERQITASATSSNLLAERIVAGMSEGLKEPLAEIQTAVRKVSGDQSEAVQKLLVDTMHAMTAQIRDLFGNQITGINEMQQKTVEAMTTAVGKLQQMVSDIGTIGEKTTEAMADKLGRAIEAMEGRQSAMDAQVRQLLEEVKTQVQSSNTTTHQSLQDALAQVSNTMGEAVRNLQSLVDKASTRDMTRAQLMETKTHEALANVANTTTQAVTTLSTEVRGLIEQSSTASTKNMQEALASVSDSVAGAVRNLQSMVDKASARDVERANLIETRTQNAVAGLSEKTSEALAAIASQVDALIRQSAEVSRQMGEAVNAMRQITTDSTFRMSQGADRLYAASDKFAAAGAATTEVLERAQAVAKQLGDTSGALTGSASVLNSAISDYKTTRDALTEMVAALRSTVDSAKKEASLTADILARIERSAQTLASAEAQAERYLQDVSEVLGAAHQQFGAQIIATLGEVNGRFHEDLTRATNSLAGAIEDLEGVFDKLPS